MLHVRHLYTSCSRDWCCGFHFSAFPWQHGWDQDSLTKSDQTRSLNCQWENWHANRYYTSWPFVVQLGCRAVLACVTHAFRPNHPEKHNGSPNCEPHSKKWVLLDHVTRLGILKFQGKKGEADPWECLMCILHIQTPLPVVRYSAGRRVVLGEEISRRLMNKKQFWVMHWMKRPHILMTTALKDSRGHRSLSSSS